MTIERAREIFDLDLATASPSDLRMRWHDLLRQHHPDLGDPTEESARNEMTLRINAAYRVLEIALEQRDGDAPPAPIDLGDGWSFSTEQPDWWPKEPYKRPKKRSRGSGPTSRATPFSDPGAVRQRVLFGAVTLWLFSSRIDPLTTLGSLICLAIVLSLYEGRVAPIIGDVLRPIEKWASRRG
jgi:hypothetical protein